MDMFFSVCVLSAGHAACVDGGKLSDKVRPLSPEHQVLPGPDGPALRLVSDLCELVQGVQQVHAQMCIFYLFIYLFHSHKYKS